MIIAAGIPHIRLPLPFSLIQRIVYFDNKIHQLFGVEFFRRQFAEFPPILRASVIHSNFLLRN